MPIGPEDDGMLEPACLDVFAKLSKLCIVHHREHIGGGVHLVYFAPLAHAAPAFLAKPRGFILAVGWRSIHAMTSASVQNRNRPIMRPGGKPRLSIQLLRVFQVRTIRLARRSSKRRRFTVFTSQHKGSR